MAEDCRSSGEFENVHDIVCWALAQIASPFDSKELIDRLLRGLKEITGSVRGDILLYQSDMNVLFFTQTMVSDGSPGNDKVNLADTKRSAPVEALTGGHTVLVADVRNSGLQSLSSGSRTLLSIPVIYGERMHGVMNFEHALPDAYDPESVRWMEALASFVAVLLEQSYLTEQVFRLNQRLIDQMTDTASASDPNYRMHAERVSKIAVAIARELDLKESLIQAVRDSGYLHDIGKTGVSESILVKPGNLTVEEFDEVRRHPILGRFLLKPLGFQPDVIEGVASHHEKWDGTGYPRGLAGNQIPIAGRILAVAEAFDVMTSDQPYRKKMENADAMKDIQNHAGQQFDPEVVEALTRVDTEAF